MKNLPIQVKMLVNTLSYCHFTNPISGKLIISLSEKLQICPKLLMQQLIRQVEQIQCKNDIEKRIESINLALAQSKPITKELKERLAVRIGGAASSIH